MLALFVLGREHQGRAAIVALRFYRRLRLQQRPDDFAPVERVVDDRVRDRGDAILVAPVDLRARRQLFLNIFRVATLSGFEEFALHLADGPFRLRGLRRSSDGGRSEDNAQNGDSRHMTRHGIPPFCFRKSE